MSRPLLLLGAAALVAAPTTASAPSVAYAHNAAAIVRVFCISSVGADVGTAVKIGADQYITALHVVVEGICTANGSPITVTYRNAEQDFAMFTGAPTDAVMPVSCRGYRAGDVYLARGYGNGGTDDYQIPWIATELTNGLERMLVGEAVQGMSGGPVIDRDGRVVGIVNQRWATRSLPLNLTKVCP